MYNYNQLVNFKNFPREKYLGSGVEGYSDQEIGFKRHNCDNSERRYIGN